MILKSWYGIGFYSTLLDSVGKETGMTGYINTRNGLLQMKGQIIPGDYGNFDSRFIRLAGSQNISGILRSSSEYQSTSANSYRSVYGNYGTFWRNDGANLYLMVTNAGDQYGAYNDLRPLAINLASGYPTMSRLALSDYTNFDARYYTKSQSDAGYMPKVSAYTKAESDARYQTKGNYITGVRFGASAEYNERGNTERMTGGVMTSFADRGSSNYWIRLRPLQYQINGGAWVTAAYA